MEEAVRTGRTGHPMLAAVSLTRLINQQCGGPVVRPWELDELPDEWIDVFLGLNDASAVRERVERIENMFREFRRKHPTYRKYLN